MKKLLDFIIIFLLVYLTINLLNPQEQVVQKQEIVFNSIESNYTVPASVKLNLENNRPEELSYNLCEDFKINISGNYLDLDESFCNTQTLKASEKTQIDLSLDYDKFLTIGNYVVTANLDEKEYITTFEIENKWAFSKVFTWLLYAPAYNLLIFLMDIFSGSLGWAIVVITLIIRALIVWPQHKMMISQKKLQALQPKIKEIQEKYKWNNQVLGMKMMELYKKEKVNPMWSCGFLLIQMPILLVLYNIILYVQDPANHYYIYSVLSGFDLTSISYSFYWIELLNKWWTVGIILWLTVWIIQFIQIKLSLKNNKNNSSTVLEKKKWANDYSAMMPNPETMNKFMLYGMPGMIAVFTYNFPAGLGMYWWISTLFMIFQQLVVNKVLKKSS